MATNERFAYSSAPERREWILQFVGEQGYCTIGELSERLSVSEMTVRRDVGRLVGEGKLRGFHGGVGSLTSQEMRGRAYSDRDRSMALVKQAIAERALRFAQPGSAIAIDSGTTATQFAALLPIDLGVRVVTPSLPAVSVLADAGAPGVTCLGGELHVESLSFAGPATLEAIADLQIDTLFLSASGLNERGTFCATGFDAITKRALIEVSDQVVLICDSSKFELSAMVKVCGWEAIDTLVTDSGIGHDSRAVLRDNDVDLEVVTP